MMTVQTHGPIDLASMVRVLKEIQYTQVSMVAVNNIQLEIKL